MIILSQTTDILEVVLGGAITTSQARCVASWRDITTSAFTPGRTTILTNSATPVSAVAAPAASTQRVIDLLNVYNSDTVAATVTIQYNDNGTRYVLWSGSLATLESVQYIEGFGWCKTSASGAPVAGSITSVSGTTAEITAVNTSGNVTLSLPAALTFTGKTVTGGTFASVTLTAPILGTPTSGNLVNCTGYVGTSALVTVGALNSGSITSGFGSIDVGADSITGGAISGTTGTFTGNLAAGAATAATTFSVTATNLDNTSGTSNARLQAVTGGSSGGDPYAYFLVTGNTEYAMGIDNSDGDKFKISKSATLGTSDVITIDGSLNTTFGGNVTGQAGSFTTALFSGNVRINSASGILNFVGTAATDPALRWDASGVLGVIAGDQSVYAKIKALDFIGTIGATTPAAGSFTTLNASGAVTATGAVSTLSASKVTTDFSAGAGRLLAFGPDNSTAATLQLGVISANASVGNAALLVISTTGLVVAGAVTNTYAGAGPGTSITNSDDTSGSTFVAFKKANGTTIASVQRVAATDAVSYLTTSDEDVKTNITEVDHAKVRAALKKVAIYDFNYKTGNQAAIGVIAQRLAAADPIFVELGIVMPGTTPANFDYDAYQDRKDRTMGRRLRNEVKQKTYAEAVNVAQAEAKVATEELKALADKPEEVADVGVILPAAPLLESDPEDTAPDYRLWSVNYIGLMPFLIDFAQQESNRMDDLEARLVAQEVHAAHPVFDRIGCVTPGDNDPETVSQMRSVGGSPLDALLVAELQSLRARVNELEEAARKLNKKQ